MYRTLFLLFIATTVIAQQNTIVVDDILLSGNKKTKEHIILRELEFKVGDTLDLDNMSLILALSEQNLIRTRLFFEVGINWQQTGTEAAPINVIEVDVKEAWYIYPAVIFELADRNFNVWWNEMERSFKRVNYGLRMDHLNTTGRRDKLKLKLQTGYTNKYEIAYFFPFLNKAGTWGTSFNILYAQNKEIGYRAEDNVLQFYRSENNIYNRVRVSSAWIYRPHFRQDHTFKLEWYTNNIRTEEVGEQNPLFFRSGRDGLTWFVAEYEWSHNDLNHFNYPTDGTKANLSVRKEGLGVFGDVNLLHFKAEVERYHLFPGDRWSLGYSVNMRKTFTPDNPGYYHNTALGYGRDQLRGYELVVIDGLDYAYTKTHLNYLLFDVSKTLGRWVFISEFRSFQMKTYASMSMDFGYVHSPYFNETNGLNNTFLFGGGPSLHVLFYNYFLLKVDYSINRQGEKGVFLHFNASF